MIFNDAFKQSLRKEVIDVQMDYCGNYTIFEEDGPPIENISIKEIGTWLWVSAHADYEGHRWDPSTDRLKGDPYSARVELHWIGRIDSAPERVSCFDELHQWAIFCTRYKQEYTDVGEWGVHSDRYVTDVTSDGIVSIRTASNRTFHDVHPTVETRQEQVSLSIFEPRSFENLVQNLDDKNPLVREIASRLLDRLRDPRVVDPYLIEAVNDESEYVQDLAIYALGNFGGTKSIEKLISRLNEKYPRKSVVIALSKIGEETLSYITPLQESESQYIRLAIVTILQNIGSHRAIEMLRNALTKNTTPEYLQVRLAIITALGQLNASDAAEDVIQFLGDSDQSVRQETAIALGKMNNKLAIDALVNGLSTCKHSIRRSIIESLEKLGWKPANPIEESLVLSTREEWTKLLTMPEISADIILHILSDIDSNHRGKILSPLCKSSISFKDERVADAIIDIYRDEEQADYRQREALEALRCVPIIKTASFLIREYTKIDRDYFREGILNSLKHLVFSELSVSDILISHLAEENTVNLSKGEIKSYLNLFTLVPLAPNQLRSIKPWIMSIDEKSLDKDTEAVVSDILALESVIPDMAQAEFSFRKKAMKVLESIHIPSAIYPLLDALEDSNFLIRERVPKLIDKLGWGALPLTIESLNNENYRVRMNAAEALGRLRFIESVEQLLIAMNDEHPLVRQNAAWAIGKVRLESGDLNYKDTAIQSLTKAFHTDDYFPVKVNAILSLGLLRDQRTLDILLEALECPEREFRINASHGLVTNASNLEYEPQTWERITTCLIPLLSDEESIVRYNAVDALRFYGGKNTLKALHDYKNDPDEEMQNLVHTAINEIKTYAGKTRASWSYYYRVCEFLRDPQEIEELIPFFMGEDENLKRTTQIAISKFGTMAYDRMMELLTDRTQHYQIRMGAAATLGEIGDRRATETLTEFLDDEHDDVRCNVAWALAELQDRRSIDALLNAITDSNWQVRLNAGAGLGKMGGNESLQGVLDLLKDEHPKVRVLATSYLHCFDDSKVMPALQSMLNDEDIEVREMAMSWIQHLDKERSISDVVE